MADGKWESDCCVLHGTVAMDEDGCSDCRVIEEEKQEMLDAIEELRAGVQELREQVQALTNEKTKTFVF